VEIGGMSGSMPCRRRFCRRSSPIWQVDGLPAPGRGSVPGTPSRHRPLGRAPAPAPRDHRRPTCLSPLHRAPLPARGPRRPAQGSGDRDRRPLSAGRARATGVSRSCGRSRTLAGGGTVGEDLPLPPPLSRHHRGSAEPGGGGAPERSPLTSAGAPPLPGHGQLHHPSGKRGPPSSQGPPARAGARWEKPHQVVGTPEPPSRNHAPEFRTPFPPRCDVPGNQLPYGTIRVRRRLPALQDGQDVLARHMSLSDRVLRGGGASVGGGIAAASPPPMPGNARNAQGRVHADATFGIQGQPQRSRSGPASPRRPDRGEAETEPLPQTDLLRGHRFTAHPRRRSTPA
jgi:hypothetical protein